VKDSGILNQESECMKSHRHPVRGDRGGVAIEMTCGGDAFGLGPIEVASGQPGWLKPNGAAAGEHADMRSNGLAGMGGVAIAWAAPGAIARWRTTTDKLQANVASAPEGQRWDGLHGERGSSVDEMPWRTN
jgi:hypothetical protein